VTEPFAVDFKEKAFVEPLDLFWAYVSPIYSVEVELHGRSMCCANFC
jgi:hypothetical protein